MPVLVPLQDKGGSLTNGCTGGGLSCFVVKMRLTGKAWLSDQLHQMISIRGGTGLRARGLATAIFERTFMPTISPQVLPVLMLFASNVFMTFAWYGHLKYKESWLPLAIMVSWGIAFFEYWLAVPANRWGSAVYTAAQLKTMQEVITLVVFAGFSVLYLKEPLGWNHGLGFAFIALGAFFIFHKWS
jgi:uncharacterized protein (DUF486 family)